MVLGRRSADQAVALASGLQTSRQDKDARFEIKKKD